VRFEVVPEDDAGRGARGRGRSRSLSGSRPPVGDTNQEGRRPAWGGVPGGLSWRPSSHDVRQAKRGASSMGFTRRVALRPGRVRQDPLEQVRHENEDRRLPSRGGGRNADISCRNGRSNPCAISGVAPTAPSHRPPPAAPEAGRLIGPCGYGPARVWRAGAGPSTFLGRRRSPCRPTAATGQRFLRPGGRPNGPGAGEPVGSSGRHPGLCDPLPARGADVLPFPLRAPVPGSVWYRENSAVCWPSI